MNIRSEPRRSVVAASLYGLLNPIPFGCFVAALIFDVIYAKTAEIMWTKSAAWLILFGLLFAVVPRLVNLAQVWITSRRLSTRAELLDFWLNVFAVGVAILNSFVHSRDAYGVVPNGLWLSIVTVALLAVGHILVARDRVIAGVYVHE